MDDDSLCLSIKQFSRETQFLLLFLLSCRDFCFSLSFIFYGIGIAARRGHLLRKSLFSSFPSVSAFYLFVCRPNTGRVLASPSRSHFSFPLSCRLSQSGDKNLPKYLSLLLPLLPEFLCGPWTANCFPLLLLLIRRSLRLDFSVHSFWSCFLFRHLFFSSLSQEFLRSSSNIFSDSL